jgi:hypothetical protein
MNLKLIIKAVLLNSCIVIASVFAGLIIIYVFASHLFNLNVEDYSFAIALVAGLPISFVAYKKAASWKIAHAATVYLLTLVSIAFVIFVLFLLIYIFFRIYCAYNPCNIIPFL